MRIAVDVMGGDHAPDAILAGCVQGLDHLGPADRMVLVGPEPLIKELLSERACTDSRVEIHHAPDTIAMDDSPVEAVRGKRHSSLVQMALLGSHRAENRCDVVLSAGNTGACVAAATMYMRRLAGVHRPGIAVTIPTFKGPVVMSDVGGNPEPRPSHLWQYGVMADMIAKTLHGIKSPRVAVMNIGSEEGKGTSIIHETAEMLRRTPGLNYIGYIEGREVFNGGTDVVVTDGFVGNALLKMIEGMAKAIVQGIAEEIMANDPAAMMMLEPVFKVLFKKMDYHEYGGAPLVGVNGVCGIAHGSSEAKTIRSAIRNSRAFFQSGTNEAIVRRLAELEAVMGPAAAVS